MRIHNNTGDDINIAFVSVLDNVNIQGMHNGEYQDVNNSPGTLDVFDGHQHIQSHYGGVANNAYIRADPTKGRLWVDYG